MRTIGDFFVHSLVDCPKAREILSLSPPAIVSGQCLIHCQSESHLQDVRGILAELCPRLQAIGIKEVILSLDGKERNRVQPELILQWQEPDEPTIAIFQSIPTNTEQAIAIIRMSDNRGLFCTDRAAEADGANPNDWVGENILKFNIREHFDRYIADLHNHRSLTEYELTCLDGQGNKQIHIINARLLTWRGDLVRVVEVLQKRYI